VRLGVGGLPTEFTPPPPRSEILTDEFRDARRRIEYQLAIINGIALVFGAGASFVLSGITLRPIKKSLEQQQQFVADAAHELKTPLTALKTSLEVSLMDKKLPLKAQKVLRENLHDLTSLESLTENLLTLARAGEEQMMKMSPVLATKLVSRAVSHIRPLATAKKIRLISTISSKNLQISGDEDSLLTVLLMLLDNAVKYSPTRSTIKIIFSQKKQQAVIQVIDQGIGISQDHLAQIFDRFYQVESSRTKTGRDGYGLGLSVAQTIVEQHRGNITVKSQPQQGTVFTVLLPLS
jgi:signal transduction histidine kinase